MILIQFPPLAPSFHCPFPPSTTRVGASGDSIQFLFDTGASVSIISSDLLQRFAQHGLVANKFNCKPNIFDASGSKMTCLGVFNLKNFYAGQPLEGTFIVSSSLSGPPILGMNIMSKYGLTLDPAARTISPPAGSLHYRAHRATQNGLLAWLRLPMFPQVKLPVSVADYLTPLR